MGPQVQETIWSGDGVAFKHGYTYSGHAAACAAALANLTSSRMRALSRVATLRTGVGRDLSSLASNPLLQEVRTAGTVGAVELSQEDSNAAGLVEEVIST